MKKLLLFAAIVILTLELYAQPQVGKVLLGGGFSFANLKAKEKDDPDYGSNTNSLAIIPRIGYSFTERFEIGAFGGISHSKRTYNDNDDEGLTKGYVIGLYLRHYLILKQGGVFLEESIDYGNSKSTSDETPTVLTKDFSIGVSSGVYYYLTERLSLEARIGWIGFISQGTTRFDLDGVERYTRYNNSFDIQFNPQSILFGLKFTLF